MKNIYFFTFLIVLHSLVFPQQNEFNINLYKEFLNSHQNMNTEDLLNLYQAGSFESKAIVDNNSALYFDTIAVKCNLTDYEKSLLSKNSFFTTERLRFISSEEAFEFIYWNDLPVFISTDAILNAFHHSYDAILKDVELGFIIDKLTGMLDNLDNNLSQLDLKYASDDSMQQALKDVDVYLTVPRKLLDENSSPHYFVNIEKVNEILNMIGSEQGNVPYTLFSKHCVIMDWSQFKPRGHYTDDRYPVLAKYFKAMMWLGRINIILLDSKSAPIVCLPQDFYDLKRQTLMTFLISELFDESDTKSDYREIENVLEFFVGKPDNVTLDNINYLKGKLNITSTGQLVDSLRLVEFQDSLKNQSFANQMILSQILYSGDVTEPDSIIPPSAFKLFGQRFIIDSYVTASVVYDRIRYNGTAPCRLFPSVLDPLFALGNDAAAQLLRQELDQYHYSRNLAALRYLIDSYPDDFWNQTLYNMWLNSIRKLNPPADRKSLPGFMQTAAYWQEKINTQLASWAELRHDNLLYAKQSYTGGVICSYPYSYVEPFPEFYENLKTLAHIAKDKFQTFNFTQPGFKEGLINYFSKLYAISDTLMQISQKELSGINFSDEEKSFLKRMLILGEACGEPNRGWYVSLFYSGTTAERNFIVADIHTVPTRCDGTSYGGILHIGTGPVNLAVVIAKLHDNQLTAFIGPVSSFYEYRTTDFFRLTDEEWLDTLQTALKPGFVNLYLADINGENRGEGVSLLTSVKGNLNSKEIPESKLLVKNYPNPFNPSTVIRYSIPYSLSNNRVKLTIYDIKGSVVKVLVNDILPAGNYLTRWDGDNEKGNKVSSGVYIYNLRVSNESISGKMTLLK